jgi:hypothetical protein
MHGRGYLPVQSRHDVLVGTWGATKNYFIIILAGPKQIKVTGTFKNNVAPDGAAVHFRHVRPSSTVDVGGLFEVCT